MAYKVSFIANRLITDLLETFNEVFYCTNLMTVFDSLVLVQRLFLNYTNSSNKAHVLLTKV